MLTKGGTRLSLSFVKWVSKGRGRYLGILFPLKNTDFNNVNLPQAHINKWSTKRSPFHLEVFLCVIISQSFTFKVKGSLETNSSEAGAPMLEWDVRLLGIVLI